MNKVNLSLSNEQFNKLISLAKKSNMTVEEYIKLKLFGPTTDINSLVKEALSLINALPKGEKFTITQLFGIKWNKISRGQKLYLGRLILKESKKTEHPFTTIDKDTGNTQWYVKL